MGHLYPLAPDGRSAIEGDRPAARTRADAERLAGDAAVEALATEWLTLEAEEADALQSMADRAAGDGFIQRYEDETGRPVLAISYWKITDAIGDLEADAPPAADDAGPAEPDTDHTDDLYFRAGRTKKRKGRKKYVDPRQLDLFPGPDQQGFEHRDPHNPAIIITDEEGDGTTFGE